MAILLVYMYYHLGRRFVLKINLSPCKTYFTRAFQKIVPPKTNFAYPTFVATP